MIFNCFVLSSKADHITGGEIFYSLKSISGSQYTYAVTIKMYMDCKSYREFYNPAYISVFDKKTNERIRDILISLSNIEIINLAENDECITNPPQVCHKIGYYNFDLTLPASINGYVLTTEVFFRVNNMRNLVPGYDNVGATYTAEIPGTFITPTGPNNNSARFKDSDLVIICADHEFHYDFGATDKDGDELHYSLCDAYTSNNFFFGIDITPPAPPPYSAVPYGPEYSGSRPMGGNVSIDEKTGVISGIAPQPGTYVITVCVEEWRNGKYIALQRKDLQINVASCSFTSASLANDYQLCNSSQTIYLENLTTSPLIQSYAWNITNTEGQTIYSSTNPTVSYTFKDTGIYNIHLDVNKNAKCADSASSSVKVYPGFKPDFNYNGVCENKTTQFTDATTSVYGTINSWEWNFTSDILGNAVSTLQNPSYTYTTTGVKSVTLVTSDSKGCVDTIYKNVEIFDKPPINLAFHDTLICKPDTLMLIALGNGTYNWSPAINMINANTATPSITPQATTKYYVDLDLQGCKNRDSIIVNVVDHVTLQTMKDTTICSSDAIQLQIVSDALQYNWSPSNQLDNAFVPQPIATTNNATKYHLVANIGNCKTSADINVRTVPYPIAFAGNDTIICFGTTALLNASTDGSIFKWSPPEGVVNTNASFTKANPASTTTYIFSALDNKGCPKPGIDSVIVTVLPKIAAFAGHDTTIVINQPLQLNGSGGATYQWFPATSLSSSTVADPIAVFNQPSAGTKYKLIVTNEAGCTDSAFIIVKVYKTVPSVFIPTGFTPNHDGKNDILKPILAGIQRIEAFHIYNRWGQLLFATSTEGQGWDGTVNGITQSAGTYVWIIKAIDYNGIPYFNKGTVTLIR